MIFRPRASAWAAALLGSAALSSVWLWSPLAHVWDNLPWQNRALQISVAEAQGQEKVETSSRAPASPKCDELEARVRKFFDSLPGDLGSLTGAAADSLALETEKTINACSLYLAECENHAKAAEVSYIAAKLLYLMSARKRNEYVHQLRDKPGYVDTLKERMGKYMAEINNLARTAFDKLPPEHPMRPRALQVLGQSAAEAERLVEARKAYGQFLTLYPTDKEAASITTALARALLDLEEYEEGLKVVRQGLEKFHESEQYPFLNEMFWKLVHSKGDLDGMLECVKRVNTVYPQKLAAKDIKDSLRETLERFLDFNGFRHGYTLFALGDFEGAKTTFRAHIATIDKKAERLKAAGKDLKPEVKIYQDRSATILRVLEELVGLPPPVDLDLGNTWVTPKTVRLAEARGKVVGLVLRGIGDERSAVFIGPLSQWTARQQNMELVSVHFRKPGQNIAQLQDELKEELARVRYESAAGFDPDEQNKTIFRRHLANIGSATFIVLNRRGELVWFQQDPRGIDVKFAEAVMAQWAQR